MQEVYNDGVDFFDVEQRRLGFTHAEVGGIIADKWRFTSDIEDAIANHHQPDHAWSAPELTQIVSMANSICHKLGSRSYTKTRPGHQRHGKRQSAWTDPRPQSKKSSWR